MVGRLVLVQVIMVRVHVPELRKSAEMLVFWYTFGMKNILKLLGQFSLLEIVMVIGWVGSIALIPNLFNVEIPEAPNADEATVLFRLGLAAALNVAILMYATLKSSWSGWKLVGVVFLQLFGIQFFLSQIEAWYFHEDLNLSVGFIGALLFSGFVLAIVYSPLSVLILKKWKPEKKAKQQKSFSFKANARKLVLLAAVIYPALYFSAGYFIAWQFEDVRLLYSGSTEILPFFRHFADIFASDPWFYPWQILRGAIWILIGLPVLRMWRGDRKEVAIVLGLLFALLMNTGHLIPNPSMPGNVPLAHFIETASSNFIWGFITAYVLYQVPKSKRKRS